MNGEKLVTGDNDRSFKATSEVEGPVMHLQW